MEETTTRLTGEYLRDVSQASSSSQRRRKKRKKKKLPRGGSSCGRARLRHRQWHVPGWFPVSVLPTLCSRRSAGLSFQAFWFVYTCADLVWLVTMHLALCSLLASPGPDARHHGRCEPEGQLRGEILADMVPVVQTAENCGNSAVAVHQGRRHFLHGAEADSRGPCDHRVSPVARGYGGRCPYFAGRGSPVALGHGGRCPFYAGLQVAKIPVVAQRQFPMVFQTFPSCWTR